MRTFVVELGSGVDLHGQDPTKAAVRAVRDAFQHVSLPGLRAVAAVQDMSAVAIEVRIGVPAGTGEVDVAQVKAQFPIGTVSVQVEPGGLLVPGDAFRPEFGDRVDAILMANAAIFVRVP
ncbi:MAG: Lin0512 family protein [Chloroflexota bacterium]